MRRLIMTALVMASLAAPVWAQRDFSAVELERFSALEIETVQVSEGVYMLVGHGGKIGLSVGEDGAFVIDDQWAPLSAKVMAAIAALTDADGKFLVNTHFHDDHTGGNEAFGTAGALIFDYGGQGRNRTTDTRIFSEQISQPNVTQGDAIKRLAADSYTQKAEEIADAS